MVRVVKSENVACPIKCVEDKLCSGYDLSLSHSLSSSLSPCSCIKYVRELFAMYKLSKDVD